MQRLFYLLYEGPQRGAAGGDAKMLLHRIRQIKDSVHIYNVRRPELLFAPGIAGLQRHAGVRPVNQILGGVNLEAHFGSILHIRIGSIKVILPLIKNYIRIRAAVQDRIHEHLTRLGSGSARVIRLFHCHKKYLPYFYTDINISVCQAESTACPYFSKCRCAKEPFWQAPAILYPIGKTTTKKLHQCRRPSLFQSETAARRKELLCN